MANTVHLNGTAALGLQDEEIGTALFGMMQTYDEVELLSKVMYLLIVCLFLAEFKVFNIVLTALALCILATTGLYCITVCYNRTR